MGRYICIMANKNSSKNEVVLSQQEKDKAGHTAKEPFTRGNKQGQ